MADSGTRCDYNFHGHDSLHTDVEHPASEVLHAVDLLTDPAAVAAIRAS